MTYPERTPEMVLKEPKRDAKCRICNEVIPRGTMAFLIYGVRVSPKIVSLWIHCNCLRDSIIKAQEILAKNVEK